MELFHRKKLSDSDDSEDELSINRPALMVPPANEDEDFSIPPMNGEQYLRRVIEEAKYLERTKIADTTNIPLKRDCNYPELPAVKKCDEVLLFDKDWQLSATAAFSKLRLKMESLRKKLTCTDYKRITSSLPVQDSETLWRKFCIPESPEDSRAPSTSFCLALPQEKLCWLLDYLGEWLANGDISIKDGCCWAYCLLACLQLPVESGIYYYMRQIARALINKRSLLKSYSADLPHMNLLICIIGRYFNQIDLADPFIEVEK